MKYIVNKPYPIFGQFIPELSAQDNWPTSPTDEPLDAPEYMPAGAMFGVGIWSQRRACHLGYRRP